jgi:hypothetical protein
MAVLFKKQREEKERGAKKNWSYISKVWHLLLRFKPPF